jgi:hypothetical protein
MLGLLLLWLILVGVLLSHWWKAQPVPLEDRDRRWARRHRI